jgi:hypothetical protein
MNVMSPVPTRHAIATRADAERVMRSFNALSQAVDGEPRCHRMFAELCYFTTRRWIAYAPDSGAADFIYTLIRDFYRHYAECVLLSLSDEAGGRAPHWRRYFERAERFEDTGRWWDGVLMIGFGAYAHTRVDLADGIYDAVEDLGRAGGGALDLTRLRVALLGPASDEVFRGAARDFLDAHRRRMRRRRADDGSPRRRRHAWGWLWLSHLQRWRRRAWEEALEGLERGRPPHEWLHDRGAAVG